MSTNFVETLDWTNEYDFKLQRPKQCTPNINDHHVPLNETAYATVYSHYHDQTTSSFPMLSAKQWSSTFVCTIAPFRNFA